MPHVYGMMRIRSSRAGPDKTDRNIRSASQEAANRVGETTVAARSRAMWALTLRTSAAGRSYAAEVRFLDLLEFYPPPVLYQTSARQHGAAKFLLGYLM